MSIEKELTKQNVLMIESKTYINLLENPNSSTAIHEWGQDWISKPNRLEIEISIIGNEGPPMISLASSTCAHQNRNEEDMLQFEIITRKDQIQQPIVKYIPRHLKKAGKT